MTQEDKELLLKDLCARLPYGVKIDEGYEGDLEEPPTLLTINHLNTNDNYPIETIKPFLRPMSSMTEEERNEYLDVKMQECERVALAEVYRPEAISIVLDWLNSHHFDYRGLIEKGLALEAPMDMYKTE